MPNAAVIVEPLGRDRFTYKNVLFYHYGIPAGKYKVRIRHLGYLPVDKTMTVS